MAEGPRKLDVAPNCFDMCLSAFLSTFKAILLPCKTNNMFLTIFGILIFMTPPASNAFGSNKTIPLHHFNLSCEKCHESAPSKNDLNSDISSLCSTPGCHDYDPILNHAVDISSQGNVPEGMPLDDDQRITCLTCHESTTSSGGTNERLLQTLQDSDNNFCGQCHTSMSGSTMEMSHWQFSNRAHLETINPNSNASDKPVQFLGPLDKETHTCLSCHTDVKVTIPAMHESESRKRARWATMTDHPVGVDYRSFALQKAPGTFFYPRANPGRVRLFKGKVGCGSCHTLYAQNKSRTNETLDRGRICVQCHNK